jgi:Holliday junction resolvasome RuvABC ATP-dependent DNA helicase subunit
MSLERGPEAAATAPAGPEAGQATPKARLAARLSAQYVLRALKLLADMRDGEIIPALVSVAIIVANLAPVDAAETGEPQDRSLDKAAADAARRPVSVMSIAGSLGLPYETVRRHVVRLVEAGVCQRVAGGVVITAEGLASFSNEATISANLAGLRRLHRQLRRAGIDLD